jgi:PAS domain S-box-containing protein
MFDKEFLKTLIVMYVEDDNSIRESLGMIFNKVFKEVVMCVDGQDGLEKFKLYNEELNTPIDAIVSDINMPKLNGLKMVAKIREENSDIPVIMTTAHGETDFFMEAIRINVSSYALKPINTPDLLSNIQKFCLAKHQRKLIERKDEELSSYIEVVNQVATIAKLDKENNFIRVNELFLEASAYKEDEIIGKSLLEITHSDIASTTYIDMQNSIKKGHNWEGLYKSVDKNKDIFYLRVSVIPKLDSDVNELTSYVMLGFIATEGEKERRDVMHKVRENIIGHKQKETLLKSKIKQLEITKKQFEIQQKSTQDISFIRTSLEKNKSKISSLLNQVGHYEKEISQLKNKLSSIVATEISKRQDIMTKNKSLQKENTILQEKVITLQSKIFILEKKQKIKDSGY